MKPAFATPCRLAALLPALLPVLLLSTPLATFAATPFSFSSYPLFLAPAIKPNVMIILDNSESMDATMAGKVINGDDPSTRGNIARGILRGLLSSYRDSFNFGITSFNAYGPSLYNTHAYYLGTATTMVYTNDCVAGISASNAGRRCLPNPEPGNGFSSITYERSGDDADVNDVLYSPLGRDRAVRHRCLGHDLRRLHRSQRLDQLDGGGLQRQQGPFHFHTDRRRLPADRGDRAAPALGTARLGLRRQHHRRRADQRGDPRRLVEPLRDHDHAARQRDLRGFGRDQEQRLLHADRRHALDRARLLPRRQHADHADLPAQLRDARDRRQSDRPDRRQPVRPIGVAEHPDRGRLDLRTGAARRLRPADGAAHGQHLGPQLRRPDLRRRHGRHARQRQLGGGAEPDGLARRRLSDCLRRQQHRFAAGGFRGDRRRHPGQDQRSLLGRLEHRLVDHRLGALPGQVQQLRLVGHLARLPGRGQRFDQRDGDLGQRRADQGPALEHRPQHHHLQAVGGRRPARHSVPLARAAGDAQRDRARSEPEHRAQPDTGRRHRRLRRAPPALPARRSDPGSTPVREPAVRGAAVPQPCDLAARRRHQLVAVLRRRAELRLLRRLRGGALQRLRVGQPDAHAGDLHGLERRHAARDQRQQRQRAVRLRALGGDRRPAEADRPQLHPPLLRRRLADGRRRVLQQRLAHPAGGRHAGRRQGPVRPRRHRSLDVLGSQRRQHRALGVPGPRHGLRVRPAAARQDQQRPLVGGGERRLQRRQRERARLPVRDRRRERHPGRQDRHRRRHRGEP